jgi:hypothetical protein
MKIQSRAISISIDNLSSKVGINDQALIESCKREVSLQLKQLPSFLRIAFTTSVTILGLLPSIMIKALFRGPGFSDIDRLINSLAIMWFATNGK